MTRNPESRVWDAKDKMQLQQLNRHQRARMVTVATSLMAAISALSFAASSPSDAASKSASKNASKTPPKSAAKASVKNLVKPAAKGPDKKSANNAAKKPANDQALTPITTKPRSVILPSAVPAATAPLSATAAPTTVALTAALITTTIAPTTVPTTPPTPATSTSTPTTGAPTTTTFEFDLQIPSPRAVVNMGSTTAMLVLVLPRGVPRPIDLFFVDLPTGITATGTPNPTTGGSEVRLSASSLMVPGEYPLRVMAVAGTTTKFVGFTLTVLAPGATTTVAGSSSAGTSTNSTAANTTTTTTTTTIPTGSGGFTFVVTSDGKKLKTGGVVTLTAVVTPSASFGGAAALRVLDLPEGVWAGFSQNPSAGTSSIWLSSTLPLRPGSHQLQIEAKTATQTSQVPVVLIIES